LYLVSSNHRIIKSSYPQIIKFSNHQIFRKMDPKIKAGLGVLAGIISGGLTVFAGEMLLNSAIPHPAGADMENPEVVKTFLQGLTTTNWLMLVAVYLVAALVAGFVTHLVSRDTKYRPALIAGVGLMVTTIMNFMDVGSHPTWVWIASIVGILAGAWFGGSMVARRVSN
jgi:hypothetical protein